MTITQAIVLAVQKIHAETGRASYAQQIAERIKMPDSAWMVAGILADAAACGELSELLWQYPSGATIVYAPAGVTSHGRDEGIAALRPEAVG